MALQLCVFNQWFKIEITVFAKIIVSPILIINSMLTHVLQTTLEHKFAYCKWML